MLCFTHRSVRFSLIHPRRRTSSQLLYFNLDTKPEHQFRRGRSACAIEAPFHLDTALGTVGISNGIDEARIVVAVAVVVSAAVVVVGRID